MRPIKDDFAPLPEDTWAYFVQSQDAKLLPLASLEPTRRRPDGVRNAAAYMLAASRGGMAKRDPLLVELSAPNRWRILDGNSTFAVAELSGWKLLPCVIRE